MVNLFTLIYSLKKTTQLFPCLYGLKTKRPYIYIKSLMWSISACKQNVKLSIFQLIQLYSIFRSLFSLDSQRRFLKMISRRADPLESMHLVAPCCTQLVLELEDKKYVPEILQKLEKYVVALHVKSDGNNLVHHEKKPEIFEIPKSITTFSDIAEWHFDNHTLPQKEAMASLAVRDNIISINCDHLCGDGGYLKTIVENIVKDGQPNPEPLPISAYELVGKSLHQYENSNYTYYSHAKDISRIFPKLKPDKKASRGLFEVCSSKIKDLTCYMKNGEQKGKVKGLTEALWAAFTLSIAAYNDKLDPCGLCTVVDMRRYIPNGYLYNHWNMCQYVSHILTYANINEKQNVTDLTRQMRESLNKGFNEGCHYKTMVTLKKMATEPHILEPVPGKATALSNVGPIFVKRPINDIFMSVIASNDELNGMSLLTYSTVCDNHENDKVYSEFAYSDADFSRADALLLNASVDFSLRNVGFETPISEALEMIKHFQKTYKNKYIL
ncbi:hypothetical protein TRFO_30113 [Tritrichomonas foetus]|uniref:Condensation domain-containing protein n=1 Tax=Tritrichomonas foetus TaxID=1144522 RepID=A0A1J4JZM4_9EUKA|nr:hypothetical protein TRFO_30113 [Tritrichomonas foetus]|eukprot:OHT02709.1 hypothetical protein TRFO_30113 [Tritrichomonas foetus]